MFHPHVAEFAVALEGPLFVRRDQGFCGFLENGLIVVPAAK
jgi:hypothetical protein